MISKIRMEGVACFKSATELETTKKVNIIYGLNGTGKSIISNFLYDQSDPDYQQCNADNNDDEKVLVYNQQFIRDYFYEADSLKGVFSLSKENKEIEQKVKDAESALVALTEELTQFDNDLNTEEEKRKNGKASAAEITWEIRRQYSGGDRVLEYCLTGLMGKKKALFDHLRSIENPESKPVRDIAAIKKEVESLSGDSAQLVETLPLAEFGQQDIEEDEVFGLVIIGNEDSPVSSLITELNNSDWVHEGLKYMPSPNAGDSEPCPFCQERTITKTLAETIENYFDKTFEDSTNLISNLLERYETAAANLISTETFTSHFLAKPRFIDFAQKHQALEKLITQNLSKIRKKKATPSVSIELANTNAAIEALNKVIQAVNSGVELHNQRIANVEDELLKLKQEFWSVMRWDYDQTIASWNKLDSKCAKTIVGKQSDRNDCFNNVFAKRHEITNLQKSTVNIETAIENINHGLAQLGITDFSIVKHTDSLYRIVRPGESVADFASFSEGEKMLISFLYFVEICRGKQSADETIGRKIIVIDDPISSMSHIFVFNIGQLLKIEFFSSSLYEQIFVFTHSLYFFYELADSNHVRRGKTQSLFRLIKNSKGSRIRVMKYEEVQNDYHSYWVIVTDPNQSPALIANCMRNIIEYFFNFVQKADLSNVFQKPELQENRHQAFCRYISRESHSFGQNIFDLKEFDYDDFREGLKLIFDVTGYPEHYKKMTSLLSA